MSFPNPDNYARDCDCGTAGANTTPPPATIQAEIDSLDTRVTTLENTNDVIVSSGGIADLTTEQQALINEGSWVVTSDGREWVYSGTGSKVLEASYFEVGAADYRLLRPVPATSASLFNVAAGASALASNTTGSSNTALGTNALALNTTGSTNTAVGRQALYSNTTGVQNTASGASALKENTTGADNTAIGVNALRDTTSGSGNTAIGVNSLSQNTTGSVNTAIGSNALGLNTTGTSNTATGPQALLRNTTGNNNTALGYGALATDTAGSNNVAIGLASLQSNTGSGNLAVGNYALYLNINGFNNTAIGTSSLQNNSNGIANIAIGAYSLTANQTGSGNTAVGVSSLTSGTNFTNTTGLGLEAQVTASNQVQLGNSLATTYAYGAVQNRSDIRDKSDIRDTALGLQFINALRPVDFKWDMREDYRSTPPSVVKSPIELREDASDEEKAKYEQDSLAYLAYKAQHEAWIESVKLSNLSHDGSKKRTRLHHGLIAQEVKAVLDSSGVDFGGFQDHSIKGGDDVLSIGYSELIAPMIKAIQQLSTKINTLETELAKLL